MQAKKLLEQDLRQSFKTESPRTMPCRDSGLPHDTRNMATSGNVFERLLARDYPLLSSKIPRIWHHLLAD